MRPLVEKQVVSRLVRISADQDASLREIAQQSNRPVSRLIREAIEAYTGIPDTIARRRRPKMRPESESCGWGE